MLIAFLVWLWALVPWCYHRLRRELGHVRAELDETRSILADLERRASELHREARKRREAAEGMGSQPSSLEIRLSAHLARIMRARQALTPTPPPKRTD